jgi:hypothetical protein
MKKYSFLIFCLLLQLYYLLNAQPIDSMKVPMFLSTPPVVSFPANDSTVSTVGNGLVLRTGNLTANDLTDVHVYSIADLQSEAHLTINKKFPYNLVLSTNTYVSNQGWNQAIYVHNNYNDPLISPWSAFPSFPGFPVSNPTEVGGDPSTAVDQQGNLYVATMSDPGALTSIGVPINFSTTISQNFGSAWSSPNHLLPLQINTDLDKPMIANDNLPFSPYGYNLYAVWSSVNFNVFDILFSRSNTGGASFDPPILLSTNGNSGQGANVKTGPNGEVYVCWADCGSPHTLPEQLIAFSRSFLGGDAGSFSSGTSIPISGIRTSYGGQAAFNGTRVNSFPTMAVDRSCSPYRGRIYISYPEMVSGKSRVKVKFSDDHGITWSDCNLNGIVDNNYAQNWHPWITVDDASGVVCVAYLAFTNILHWETDVYLAFSSDGGATFANMRVSDVKHVREFIGIAYISLAQLLLPGYCGDYIAADAYAGNTYVAWEDNRISSKWNVFCSTVQFSDPLLFSSQFDYDIYGPLTWSGIQSSVSYEAVNNINCTINSQLFQVNSGANVNMKAGNSIHIGPPFASQNGSAFHAYIAPVAPCTVPFRISENNTIKGNNDSNIENTLIAMPNPFSEVFELKYFSEKDQLICFEIFNLSGKLVSTLLCDIHTEQGTYTTRISTNNLSPGIYYIKYSSSSESIIKKLIKI